jgi:hypothetical protein
METHRNVTLTRLIDEVGSKLGDLAAWPDSESTRLSVDASIKTLRKAFKEDSYPRAFLYLAMCQIAHDVWHDTVLRDVKNPALKAAWTKIGDLLGEDK